MKIKKILEIGLIISLLLLASFAPVSITVLAGDTDTITITFDPKGNISIDVSPGSYDFGSLWAVSNESTTSSYFTIWNNGTIDNMFTDIKVTGSPANFAIDDDSIPTGEDKYALKVKKGSVDDTPWLDETDYRDLDGDIDRDGSDTFGLNLYISNISADHAPQTITVTLRGAQS